MINIAYALYGRIWDQRELKSSTITDDEKPRGTQMIRIPTHRTPTHPGEMLLQEFLIPMGITQRELAKAIHVPYQRINELVNRRRGVTPSTALRLARYFGVSADFWMKLQLRWDLYYAQRSEARQLKKIQPYTLSVSRDYRGVEHIQAEEGN